MKKAFILILVICSIVLCCSCADTNNANTNNNESTADTIIVPNVITMHYSDAEAALEEAGFVVNPKFEFSEYFDTVMETDPPAGTALPKGSVVTVKAYKKVPKGLLG